MPTYQIIQEIDVLVATTLFLVERGIKPYRFSIAKGKGIDTESAKERLYKTFCSTPGFVPNFVNDGPDIIGISETEWWQVECKGSGKGVQSTQRNNFDRALASVVSYYEDETMGLSKQYEQYSKAQPYLGLALPASPVYLKELKRRVRQPLRKRLNLWVLLYEPESKSIRTVSPENSY
ncbi:hypothetical protein ES707_08032 [subsurface metagenome]